MSNDFLTSLSLRAIQNSGMDSGIGGLRPRLASRFEPGSLSAGQGFDENVQAEAPGAIEKKQIPIKDSGTLEQNRSEVQINQPVERGQRSEGPLISPLQRAEGPTSIPERIEPQTGPVPVEPSIAIHGQLETPNLPHLPMDLKQVPLQGLNNKEERSDSQPIFLHSAPVITPQIERVQVRETQKDNDPVHGDTYISSNEPTNRMRAGTVSLTPPTDQPKVVPERIEITHRESQLLISNIQHQLVPFIPRLERKSQASNRGPEQQPPTINVTIGRIEVKATPATASPKRGAHTATTVSLEEYLKRRQAGGS